MRLPTRVGEVWLEKRGRTSKAFLVLGLEEGAAYKLLNLETGRRDSVWERALNLPMEAWERLA